MFVRKCVGETLCPFSSQQSQAMSGHTVRPARLTGYNPSFRGQFFTRGDDGAIFWPLKLGANIAAISPSSGRSKFRRPAIALVCMAAVKLFLLSVKRKIPFCQCTRKVTIKMVISRKLKGDLFASSQVYQESGKLT